MSCVRVEERPRQIDDRGNAAVGDAVVHEAVFPPRLDEPAPTEAAQVVRDGALRDAQPLDDLADGELALRDEKFEDPKTCRIAESPEVLGEELGPLGHPREAKRRVRERFHLRHFSRE